MSRHSTPKRFYTSCDSCGAESEGPFTFSGGASVALCVAVDWRDNMNDYGSGTLKERWDLCPECSKRVDAAIRGALEAPSGEGR